MCRVALFLRAIQARTYSSETKTHVERGNYKSFDSPGKSTTTLVIIRRRNIDTQIEGETQPDRIKAGNDTSVHSPSKANHPSSLLFDKT